MTHKEKIDEILNHGYDRGELAARLSIIVSEMEFEASMRRHTMAERFLEARKAQMDAQYVLSKSVRALEKIRALPSRLVLAKEDELQAAIDEIQEIADKTLKEIKEQKQ